MRLKTLALLALIVFAVSLNASAQKDGWISLFDGKSLSGWKVNEHPETFSVVDGAIQAFGERSHLFYDGSVGGHDFKNFELKLVIMTNPGSNSGVFIHTAFQPDGWPSKGYEIQVNNTQSDWRRTGSVYSFQDVKEAPAKDNEWFTMIITVKDKHITIKVNDKVINDYTETTQNKLSSGTIALQGHDPKSKVLYKEVAIKQL